MSQINRVPWALQDLLGSQNLGTNPSNLAGDVHGVTDLFPHWASERLTVADTTAWNVNTSNTGIPQLIFTIPQGQAWIPLYAATSVNFDAVGQKISWAMRTGTMPNSLNVGFSGSVAYASQKVITSLAVGEIARLEFSWQQRVLYPSGTRFLVQVDHCDVGTGTDIFVGHRVVYYRLNT